MEIEKKKIHMDRVRAKTQSQITLEDDINIPENKQDVNRVLLYKGTILIDEIKPGTDVVNVKGQLAVAVLYHSAEEGNRLVSMEGRVPFEEKIHFEGIRPSDTVHMKGELEDLTVGLINSRKLRIQSVITMDGILREVYEEALPVGLTDGEAAQYRTVPMELATVVVDKKDVIRLKEEVTLPGGYPNIYQILWSGVTPCDFQFKPKEDMLEIRGDVALFVMYEAEGDGAGVRTFETVIPFDAKLDCPGCMEGDYVSVIMEPGQQEVGARPDLDGEERNISLEWSAEPVIRVYREQREELLTDLYGVTKEIETKEKKVALKQILNHMTGKTKVSSRVPVEEKGSGIMQLVHSEGSVATMELTKKDQNLCIEGVLSVKTLYITGEDDNPYAAFSYLIPYEYHMELPEVMPEGIENLSVELEQLQVTMPDAKEVEARAVLAFHFTAFKSEDMSFVDDIEIKEIDRQKLSLLPGMSIYMVREKDNLWNIGKKYYVTVKALKELNGLTQDEISPGQKLLVVKGM